MCVWRPQSKNNFLFLEPFQKSYACSRVSKRLELWILFSIIAAVNDLLKSYAISLNNAKTFLKTEQLVKLPTKKAVQFAKAFCARIVRCSKAYFNECIKDVPINSLQSIVHKDVSIFWSRKQKSGLTKLARYADALMSQQRKQKKKPQIALERYTTYISTW